MDTPCNTAVPAATKPAVNATWLVLAFVVVAVLFGFLLVVRRVGGAIASPLPASALLVTAAAIGLGLGLNHFAAVNRSSAGRMWLPMVVLLLWMIGCSWPMGRLVDWAAWLPLIVVQAVWLERRAALRIWRKRPTGSPGESRLSNPSYGADSSSLSHDTAHNIVQQLIRCRDEAGNDVLTGTVSTMLAPQQRSGEIYVAFCPPFEAKPQFEFEQVEGPEARAKVGRLLPHGARVDIKLPGEVQRPTRVAIELYVHADNARGIEPSPRMRSIK